MFFLWVLLIVVLTFGLGLALLVRRGLRAEKRQARSLADKPRMITFYPTKSGIAAVKGQPGTLGVDLGRELIRAAKHGDMTAVTALTAMGADVNTREPDTGNSSLHAAAWQGSVQAVEVLVKAGAAVNATNHQGLTALMTAASEGHLEVVRFLLSKGAGVDAVNRAGHTALWLAIRRGRETIAQILRDAGAAMPEKSLDE